jgi:acid stress-induced BolA-like protein IbaG/YrbA
MLRSAQNSNSRWIHATRQTTRTVEIILMQELNRKEIHTVTIKKLYDEDKTTKAMSV